MSSASQVVADQSSESYPAYEGRMHYIEGYDPCSYEAPHSSLHQISTWLGMGLVLTGLCPAGLLIFVGALDVYNSPSSVSLNHPVLYIIGICLLAVCWIGGALLIHHGRRFYRQYRAETGRVN